MGPTLAEAGLGLPGRRDGRHVRPPNRGSAGIHPAFPPAGLESRDHDEVAEAFNAYALVRGLSMLFGVCPDCGGRIDTSLDVCEDHDASEGVCENCGA